VLYPNDELEQGKRLRLSQQPRQFRLSMLPLRPIHRR
jgi:hypothetical protein